MIIVVEYSRRNRNGYFDLGVWFGFTTRGIPVDEVEAGGTNFISVQGGLGGVDMENGF
jgi:hypothetical protein